MRYRILTATVVAGALAALVLSAVRAPKPLVTAEFQPEYSDWHAWRVFIDATGEATQDSVSENPKAGEKPVWAFHKTVHLPRPKVSELLATISAVRFCELQPSYSATYEVRPNEYRVVTDQNTLILDVNASTCVRRVSIYGPHYVAGLLEPDADVDYPVHPNRDEARRFLVVWAKLLQLVPSPNPDETPDVYMPHDLGPGR